MIINNNISALNTFRQMGANQAAGANSMEKLSSGLRINKAGDDAAGLAISEKMRAQVRGLDQASRNSQDGISMIQTAEGALQESQNILQRMRELATQAANDTNVAVDRNEIQKEINALTSEMNRIGNTTEFNTQKLLNGGEGTTKTVSVNTVTAPQSPVGTAATAATKTAAAAVNVTTDFSALSGSTDLEVNGATVTLTNTAALSGASGQSIDDIRAALQDDLDAVFTGTATSGNGNSTETFNVGVDASGKLTISSTSTGTAATVNLSGSSVGGTDIASALGFTDATAVTGNAASSDYNAGQAGVFSFDLSQPEVGGTINVAGTTITFTDDTSHSGIAAGTHAVIGADVNATATNLATAIGANAGTSGSFSASASGATLQLTQVGSEIGNQTAPTVSTATPAGTGFSATFQIGANNGQSMTINVLDMRAEALGVASAVGADTTMTVGDSTSALAGKTGTVANAAFAANAGVSNGTDNTNNQRALSVATHEEATAAIEVINNAIETVSAQRSNLGAFQNRLEHTISNLSNASENLQAAESRIRDVDMAKEVMEMTRANILGQASQAMLAQANQKPQSVLQLLG